MDFLKATMVAALLISPRLALAQSSSQGAQRASQTKTADVLARLHHANAVEIRLGDLADAKAEAPGVRQYGQQLVRHHRDADKMVMDLAKQENLTLETKHASSDTETSQRLKQARGAEFDREFLNTMVTDHENVISMVKQAASESSDAKLKQLLEKLLPTLEEHRDHAKGLLAQTR